MEGDRISEAMLLIFWLKEMFTGDIYDLIPSSQPFSAPMQEFEWSMASLVLHYKAMSYPNDDLGITSIRSTTEMNDLLYGECPNCELDL
jgi:hypothetical protein